MLQRSQYNPAASYQLRRQPACEGGMPAEMFADDLTLLRSAQRCARQADRDFLLSRQPRKTRQCSASFGGARPLNILAERSMRSLFRLR
jgi:hypothetical protein